MIDDIIQEATEAEEQGRDAGYAVGELLRIINQQKAENRELKRKLIDEQKSVEKIAVKYFAREEELERQKTEIDILIRKKEALRDEVAEQKAEKERLEYVLMAVMHSVDKWLEGDELKQDEANRACTMREKTLKITDLRSESKWLMI